MWNTLKGSWSYYIPLSLSISVLYKHLSHCLSIKNYRYITHCCIDILEPMPSSTASTYRLTGINLLPSFVILNYSQGITINTVRLTTRTGLPIPLCSSLSPLSLSRSFSYCHSVQPQLPIAHCVLAVALCVCVFVVDNVQSMSNDVVVILPPDPGQLRFALAFDDDDDDDCCCMPLLGATFLATWGNRHHIYLT